MWRETSIDLQSIAIDHSATSPFTKNFSQTKNYSVFFAQRLKYLSIGVLPFVSKTGFHKYLIVKSERSLVFFRKLLL